MEMSVFKRNWLFNLIVNFSSRWLNHRQKHDHKLFPSFLILTYQYNLALPWHCRSPWKDYCRLSNTTSITDDDWCIRSLWNRHIYGQPLETEIIPKRRWHWSKTLGSRREINVNKFTARKKAKARASPESADTQMNTLCQISSWCGSYLPNVERVSSRVLLQNKKLVPHPAPLHTLMQLVWQVVFLPFREGPGTSWQHSCSKVHQSPKIQGNTKSKQVLCIAHSPWSPHPYTRADLKVKTQYLRSFEKKLGLVCSPLKCPREILVLRMADSWKVKGNSQEDVFSHKVKEFPQ